MALPIVNLKVSKVDLGEYGEVQIRELSRRELHKIREAGEDLSLAEAITLSCGASIDLAAAQEWLEQTPSEVAGKVVDAICYLSGMGEEAPKE